ncbi:MAG: hypothetical protein J0L94_01975 [Rhodothermia bacterium]|nr:hypothetical protein [Rhodothermia bacterium]
MPTSEPIDHDSLFKELIRVFTYEFITLFAPKLAADLDRDSFEFWTKNCSSFWIKVSAKKWIYS